jgi:hypothetical protein
VKLNWRAWHAMATDDAVNKRGGRTTAPPIPAKYLKAAKPVIVKPNSTGPHSDN